jgi:plasmid stabilization system protein ParE
VETVIDILKLWPELGSELDEIKGVRAFSIPKYPYRLYYTIFRNELEILGISIYHTRRDLDALISVLERRKIRLKTK